MNITLVNDIYTVLLFYGFNCKSQTIMTTKLWRYREWDLKADNYPPSKLYYTFFRGALNEIVRGTGSLSKVIIYPKLSIIESICPFPKLG